jgi:rhodanese-related sulfurtransferase
MRYAGNISPTDAWQLFKGEPDAQLIDVRTIAEWTLCVLPDLSNLSRKVLTVQWQDFPTTVRNTQFEMAINEQLERLSVRTGAALAFLCRSGARSQAAAVATTAAGYERCFNIDDGFESSLDGEGHRWRRAGWKAAGLPWKQS